MRRREGRWRRASRFGRSVGHVLGNAMSLLPLVRVSDVLPAAGLALSVAGMMCALQLMPFGTGLLLVRVPEDGAGSALMAAARADAAFVSSPAHGYAVLYGDASKVRAAVGLAVSWRGQAPCSPSS